MTVLFVLIVIFFEAMFWFSSRERENAILDYVHCTREEKRVSTNSLPPQTSNPLQAIKLVREGATAVGCSSISQRDQLRVARDWQLRADIGRQLDFPPEIATTTLRPDLVLWPPSVKKAYIIELTVPWEDSIDEAYERKHLRYAEIAAEATGTQSSKYEVRLVEVGCRGFVATSTTKLLRDMGVRGQCLRAAIKTASEAAEKSSRWLWLKRNSPSWAPS